MNCYTKNPVIIDIQNNGGELYNSYDVCFAFH